MQPGLFLRLITIADFADPTGTFIPDGMLNGDRQAGSDLMWPYQPNPPKVYWAAFRHCLHLIFCTSTPSHERPMNGMTLDSQLGTWHAVARNTWFPVYHLADKLYYREANKIRVLGMASTSGFSTLKGRRILSHSTVTQSLTNDFGQSIWTHR